MEYLGVLTLVLLEATRSKTKGVCGSNGLRISQYSFKCNYISIFYCIIIHLLVMCNEYVFIYMAIQSMVYVSCCLHVGEY